MALDWLRPTSKRHAPTPGATLAPLIAMAATVLSLSAPRPARAWELEDAVPLPAVASPMPGTLTLTGSSLRIQGDQVVLTHQVLNRGPATRSSAAIYLPPFGWQGMAANYPDRDFPELQVQQDVQPLPLQRHVRALHAGRDISAQLRRGGINPLLVAQNEALMAPGRGARRRAWSHLVRTGAAHWLDGLAMPDWLVEVSPSWTLTWPASRSTTLSLHYRARPAVAPWGTDSLQLQQALSQHCSSLDALKAAFQKANRPWPAYVVLERFEIPLGLGPLHAPELSVRFEPRRDADLPAVVSVMCASPNGPALLGLPGIDADHIQPTDERLSVMLIRPQ
jgi:hypothetical protein